MDRIKAHGLQHSGNSFHRLRQSCRTLLHSRFGLRLALDGDTPTARRARQDQASQNPVSKSEELLLVGDELAASNRTAKTRALLELLRL